MMCDICNGDLPKKYWQCGDCLKTKYCSETCGTKHWVNGGHMKTCIGKETKTFKNNAFPRTMKNQKQQQSEFRLEEQLTKLSQQIRNLPEPTDREKESIKQSTKGMNAFELLCALQQFKEQRQELLVHDLLIGFLKDYLSSKKTVQPIVIDKIIDTLLKAETKIASAGFDFIEKDDETTLLEGTALADAALYMASSAILGDNVSDTPDDTPEQSIERHFAYAFEMAEQVTHEMAVTEQNDDFTRALGFDVDERFLGTEQEVQSRIDSGVLPKPDWWDSRMNFLFEIDLPNQELIKGGGDGDDDDDDKKQLPRLRHKKTDVTHVPTPTDKVNSDIRVRLITSKYTWKNMVYVLGRITPSMAKAWDKIIATVGVDRAHFAINVALMTGAIYCGTTMFYNYMALDHGKIDRFMDNLKNQSAHLDQAVNKINETQIIIDEHQLHTNDIVKLLNNTDVGSFTLMDIRAQMYGTETSIITPWLYNSTDVKAFEKIKDARYLSEIWLRIRLDQWSRSKSPTDFAKFESLKPWYAEITDYSKSTKEMEETLEEFTRFFVQGFAKSKPNFEGVDEAMHLVRKFLLSVQSSRKLLPVTREMLSNIKIAFQNHHAILASAEDVVNISRYAAEHTPALDRLIRDSGSSTTTMFWLHTLRGMLAVNSFIIAGTFDVKKAKAFMDLVNKGAQVSILEWAINAPVLPAKSGCYLLCNAYLLQWIASLIEYVENNQNWKPRYLQVYDDYCNLHDPKPTNEQQAILESNTLVFLRIFRALLFGHRDLLGLTGAVKTSIRYGPILGAALLYFSYVRYTGAWALNLTQDPLAILGVLPLGIQTVGGFFTNWNSAWDLIYVKLPQVFTAFHYRGSAMFIKKVFLNSFRRVIDTAMNTNSYMLQQEEDIKERRRKARGTQKTSTTYKALETSVIVMMFMMFGLFVIGRYLGIANQPHWPQYRTRRQWRDQLMLQKEEEKK
jgi:hypothetical protein